MVGRRSSSRLQIKVQMPLQCRLPISSVRDRRENAAAGLAKDDSRVTRYVGDGGCIKCDVQWKMRRRESTVSPKRWSAFLVSW